jgi:uncharacterized protein DUF6970
MKLVSANRVRAVTSLLVAALLLGCSGSPPPPATEPTVDLDALPDWVQGLIADLEAQPVANPPAYLARYWYRNEFVYFLPARCCDIPSVLYDANGAVLCLPSGGIAGGGDGRCADFFDERRDETIVWKDERGSSGNGDGLALVFFGLGAAQLMHILVLH